MVFERYSKAVKGGQEDTLTLKIPFSELPELAVEELVRHGIAFAEAMIDYAKGEIIISESIAEGVCIEDFIKKA